MHTEPNGERRTWAAYQVGSTDVRIWNVLFRNRFEEAFLAAHRKLGGRRDAGDVEPRISLAGANAGIVLRGCSRCVVDDFDTLLLFEGPHHGALEYFLILAPLRIDHKRIRLRPHDGGSSQSHNACGSGLEKGAPTGGEDRCFRVHCSSPFLFYDSVATRTGRLSP